MNVLIITTTLLFTNPGFSPDQIEGHWLAGEGQSIIEIYLTDQRYLNGKIVWLEQPNDKKGRPHTDRMNPDKDLRSQPIIGLHMLENCVYEQGNWQGQLYVPKKGRTVDVILTMVGTDELLLTVSFRGFSREITWYRSQLPNE